MRASVFVFLTALAVCGCDRAPEDEVVTFSPPSKPKMIPVAKHVVSKTRTKSVVPFAAVHKEKSAACDDERLTALSESERNIYQTLSDRLDENDLKGVLEQTKLINANSPVILREQAVESLAWFSDNLEALEQLQRFITDADEDVAGDAFRRMSENTDLIEIEENRNRFLLEMARRYPDKTAVSEYLCEKLRTYEMTPSLMNTLIDITTFGGNGAANRAREVYKEITGESYTGPEQARAWVKENAECE